MGRDSVHCAFGPADPEPGAAAADQGAPAAGLGPVPDAAGQAQPQQQEQQEQQQKEEQGEQQERQQEEQQEEQQEHAQVVAEHTSMCAAAARAPEQQVPAALHEQPL